MDKIQILMSTYNGEKYLKEQLDSILNQSYENIEILVRDDGSTDSTLEILESYAKEHENLSYYQGNNLGAIQSFFELLQNSDEKADYYAFADQDDYWLPEKLERAVSMLQKQEADMGQISLLYCSDTLLSDHNLKVLGQDCKNPRPSYGNALVQNVCTGCTAVMNGSLRELINKTCPKDIVMHDWWFYLAATICGQVIYDDASYIKYRQHGNNEVGAKRSRLDIWKYRFGQLFQSRGELYAQLQEVENWFGDRMSKEQREMLKLVLKSKKGLKNRLKLISHKSIYRNKRSDDLVYRGIVLIGKL